MQIGLCFNLKKVGEHKGTEEDMDYDASEVIDELEEAIRANGHRVIRIEANMDAFDRLRSLKGKIDLIFNYSEGVLGNARESQIPIFCEMLKIPYTHSNPTTNAIKMDKQLCKRVLATQGVNVPESVLLKELYDTDIYSGKYPVIIKPNNEGSSKGVFGDSVVNSQKDILERTKRLWKMGVKEVLVEEYIEGREFTVSLLGNLPRMLPIIEQRFDFLPDNMPHIAGFELKWIYETQMRDISEGYSCPAKVSKRQKMMIEETSVKIFKALNVYDCCRIDYRMDSKGRLYFIEINTIPGMTKDPKAPSYFIYSAYKAGMSYEQLVGEIINSARMRLSL